MENINGVVVSVFLSYILMLMHVRLIMLKHKKQDLEMHEYTCDFIHDMSATTFNAMLDILHRRGLVDDNVKHIQLRSEER